MWNIGLFGSHVDGKNKLENSSAVGINVEFYPGSKVASEKRKPTDTHEDFNSWVATPAIYMPQVLAIADEQIRNTTSTPSGPGCYTTSGYIDKTPIPAGGDTVIKTLNLTSKSNVTVQGYELEGNGYGYLVIYNSGGTEISSQKIEGWPASETITVTVAAGVYTVKIESRGAAPYDPTGGALQPIYIITDC